MAEPPATRDPDTALRIRGLRFTYAARRRAPARTALDGVDLSVARGEAVAMLGPNGSGKSTLMKLVCGLLPLQEGSCAVFGEDALPIVRRMLGVVFQSPALDPHLTVGENLREQAVLYGLRGPEARESIARELDLAGLTERSGALVKTLSGGMQRRVDLCRALLHRPRLLLLDEPTVGLDPVAREAFLAAIEARRRDHDLSVLMTTHLVDEAERHDRAVLFDEGRIVAGDAPAALCRALGRRRVTVHDAAWTPAGDREAGSGPDWGPGWTRTARGWSLDAGETGADLGDLAARLAGAGLPFSVAPPTLADVFEARTGHRLDDEELAAEPAGAEEVVSP